ncbi:hypothetical protein SISSUDRAFT_1064199 [Sistotremastrum suecicum HHB10207 ss-3]|uniref:CBM1 domain-containing protein n=1 Tax=Sistotremastrum suecicum HHB10207 ss-3 TaxID=1314776 RepID=A0A166AWM8_9AGAM|nr:hypothetical protein SISSUDRAFT_1064199 [Sistotremastrum suecicum HHB10207 ss-3]
MVSFTQYRAFLALSLWLTGLAHGQADTTSSTTTAPTPSLSLCCQTYTAYYPDGFTLCSTITNGKQPNPTDRTSDVPPTPGLSKTIYKLVTIHCGGSIPTTCSESYTWSTTYGTGPAGTTTAYTMTNPLVQGTDACPGPWPLSTAQTSSTPTPVSPPPPPTPTPSPSPSTVPDYFTQSHYGQCGGIGYEGPTAYAPSYTCSAVAAPYYSQCL